MLSNLDPPKFGAWSMLNILYMHNLKPPNFEVLSMWCILHMPDLDPQIFWTLRYVVQATHAQPWSSKIWSLGMLHILHMTKFDPPKFKDWGMLYT